MPRGRPSIVCGPHQKCGKISPRPHVGWGEMLIPGVRRKEHTVSDEREKVEGTRRAESAVRGRATTSRATSMEVEPRTRTARSTSAGDEDAAVEIERRPERRTARSARGRSGSDFAQRLDDGRSRRGLGRAGSRRPRGAGVRFRAAAGSRIPAARIPRLRRGQIPEGVPCGAATRRRLTATSM